MTKLGLAKVVEADREQACELGRRVHLEGTFSELTFSVGKFNRLFDKTIEKSENHLGLKVCLGDRIVGFSYCVFGGYFIGEGGRVATVHTICVDRDIRSSLLGGKAASLLVRRTGFWARQRGARMILFHVTSGFGVAGIDRICFPRWA